MSKTEKSEKGPKIDSLKTAIAAIEKDYGKGSIRLGESGIVKCEAISTGCLALDVALGVGGVPKGRITEIYGPEGGGKTTLALHVLAHAQKNGDTAAFIDAEHAVDPNYATNIGVDWPKCYVSQPDSGEQALGIIDKLVESGEIDIIVVDSVAALTPQSELDGEIGDQHIGAQAKMMSQALRRLTSKVKKHNVCLIFINQMRELINTFGYGEKTTTPGGRALKFYASVRIDIKRIGSVKIDDLTTGNEVKAKTVKNKVAPPFREAIFDIIFGKGIDGLGSVLDMAISHKIIVQNGSWYTYGDVRLGAGRDSAIKFLRETPEICSKIESTLREGLIPTDGIDESEVENEEGPNS